MTAPSNLAHDLRLLLAECEPSDIPEAEYERDKGADRARRIMALLDRVKLEVKGLGALAITWVGAWVAEHGELRSGVLVYRLEADREIQCKDYRGALRAIARDQALLIPGLDFETEADRIAQSGSGEEALRLYSELFAEKLAGQLAGFISKNGLTPGSCRKALGEEWGDFFAQGAEGDKKLRVVNLEALTAAKARRGGSREAVEGEVQLGQ